MNRQYIAGTLAGILVMGALQSSVVEAQVGANASSELEEVVVIGSRIGRSELTETSPVYTLGKDQLQMDRAVTVEDIQRKLPHLAGGANSTGATVGDSLGSSTLDLRGLGQNRTLVLIDGRRAAPFSFRNAVDVNSIPAGLIERVEVLTGGAAAVYGADAVAGVVNFVLDRDFEGFEVGASYEIPDGGAELFNLDLTFGSEFDEGRGHFTGYVGLSERKELLAGKRSFTSDTNTNIAGPGGFFTHDSNTPMNETDDVTFGFDSNGNAVTKKETVNVTPSRYLIQPLERNSMGLFLDYEIHDRIKLYAQSTYSQVRITGAGSTGQTPLAVNEPVEISMDNPHLPTNIASMLTFDGDDMATVNVERSLELGLQETRTNRNTQQHVVGLVGELTDNISLDVYGLYGRTDGRATVYNNGIKNVNGMTGSRFSNVANTVDIFGPGADLSSLSVPLLHSDRQREQTVLSATLSGSSEDLFELPAGPIGFAIGFENREEVGIQRPGTALREGLAYSLGGIPDIDSKFDADDIYAEILIPILSDYPFVKELSFEYALRESDYSNTDVDDTTKWGLSWAVNDSVRFRMTKQEAVRAPNFGEFAAPETRLSLALFDMTNSKAVARLVNRYPGDPCLRGGDFSGRVGDRDQCLRQGGPDPTDPNTPTNAMFDTDKAVYSFGGNPNIKPELAESMTVGMVFTPTFLEDFSLTLDYYEIEITDAVSQIQPVSALINCYIDNPVAGNPLCGAVLRDSDTGLIKQALVNDFNLAELVQEGWDLGARYTLYTPDIIGDQWTFSYQGNYITDWTRQNNATVAALDCAGTFGVSCTGDFASVLQADYRHRLNIDWHIDDFMVQLSWRRIGEVKNVLDSSDKISEVDYVDLSASWVPSEKYTVIIGIDNLLDEDPPTPDGNSNLYGTISDYDVIGITMGASVRWRF